jgi:hypothetical protein
MGNPASVKRKKTEKRRKRYEQRLGPGAYLPKEEREKLNAELEKLAAADAKRKAELKKAKEQKAKEKKPDEKK